MGERDDHSKAEMLPDDDDPLKAEKAVDSYLNVTKSNAIRLAARRFDTFEEASEAATGFIATYNKVAEGVEALGIVPVHIQGLNVRVSNITTEQIDEGGLILRIDPDEPYALAPRYAEPVGRCHALTAAFHEDEEGRHCVRPVMLFEDADSTEARIVTNGYPVAEMNVTSYIVAPLADSEFKITALEDVRRRRLAISEVALRHANDPTPVTEALEHIAAALTTAVSDDFTPYDQVGHFHMLARSVSEDEATGGEVLETFRSILGKECPVSVKGAVYVGIQQTEPTRQETIGRFIDILPTHEALEIQEPTMVIASRAPGEDERLVFVPLSHIEEFGF